MHNEQKYFPMLAGFSDEYFSSEEDVIMWEKFYTFPQKIQNILTSDELTEFVYGVEQRFHLTDLQAEEFSRTIRHYFFREITENDFAQKISRLCHVTQDDAIKLLRTILAIEPKENVEDDGNVEKKRNAVQITFANALANYPKVKDQFITGQPIVAKPFLQPLKPTLKNWIMVYEKNLGVSRHDTIERGDFVFRSEATRGLTNSERADLAYVLHARDENGQVVIDRDTSEIVFEEQQENVRNLQVNEPRNIVSGKVNISRSQQIISQMAQPKKEFQPMIQKSQTPPKAVNKDVAVSKRMDMPSQKTISPQLAQKTDGFGTINTPASNIGISSEKNTSPVFASVQDEIIKNRMEMQKKDIPAQAEMKKSSVIPLQEDRAIGTPIQKVKEEIISVAPVAPQTQATIIIDPPKKTVIEKKPLSFVAGDINFSSNHTLPSEMSQNKVSANYLNISPIGAGHMLQSNKKPKKSI